MIKQNNATHHSGMHMVERIAAMAIALALACAYLAIASPRALADGATASPSDTGVIDISYVNDGEPIGGAGLTLHRVAAWRSSGGYEPVGTFDRYADSIDWSGLNDADSETLRVAAQTLSAYAQRDGIAADAKATTDENGEASFDGLTEGLYLVSSARYEGVAESGQRMSCDASSLLVALPVAGNDSGDSGDGSASGRTMHAELSPKTECTLAPQPATTSLSVHKVWAGDGSSLAGAEGRPQSIDVQLLRDGTVADTVTLDASNRWRHAWTDLESGHDWRVVERKVPSRYVVALDREGDEVIITNTRVTPPTTGADVARVAALAAAVAAAAIGLLGCVAITRRSAHD